MKQYLSGFAAGTFLTSAVACVAHGLYEKMHPVKSSNKPVTIIHEYKLHDTPKLESEFQNFSL